MAIPCGRSSPARSRPQVRHEVGADVVRRRRPRLHAHRRDRRRRELGLRAVAQVDAWACSRRRAPPRHPPTCARSRLGQLGPRRGEDRIVDPRRARTARRATALRDALGAAWHSQFLYFADGIVFLCASESSARDGSAATPRGSSPRPATRCSSASRATRSKLDALAAEIGGRAGTPQRGGRLRRGRDALGLVDADRRRPRAGRSARRQDRHRHHQPVRARGLWRTSASAPPRRSTPRGCPARATRRRSTR